MLHRNLPRSSCHPVHRCSLVTALTAALAVLSMGAIALPAKSVDTPSATKPSAAAAEPPEVVEPQTVVRRQGSVKAELYFDRVTEPYTQYRNVQFKVWRGDRVVYERNLLDDPATKALDGTWVMADRRFDDVTPNQFFIRDLDGDGEPEIHLAFYSGGAHCCVMSAIYRYDPAAQTYQPNVIEWGDAAATFTLKNLDPQRNVPQLVSLDAGFAYAFSAYAFSGFPVKIWEYQQGELIDVTRRYPQQIRSSAYRNWQQIQSIKQQYPDEPNLTRGAIAAYMATKYLLGEAEAGWKLMEQVYQGEDKAKFFADLRQFLVQTGYAKS